MQYAMLGHILGDFLAEPARKGRALFQAPDNSDLLVVDCNIYRGQACTTSQMGDDLCKPTANVNLPAYIAGGRMPPQFIAQAEYLIVRNNMQSCR